MQSILKGREKRVSRRKKFIEKNDRAQSFLCLTINIPGADKRNEFSRRLFYAAKQNIIKKLLNIEALIIDNREFSNGAGDVFLLALDLKAKDLKKITLRIEAEHLSGRFFDIDIYNSTNQALSRKDLAYPPRKCFICSQNAKGCMRTKRHSLEEINRFIEKEKAKFYQQLEKTREKTAAFIEEIAYQALLKELFTTPKPGLVDLDDQGAHDDMTVETFLKSSKAIKPFFNNFFKIGAAESKKNKFKLLRKEGKKAEKKMFAATAGVNTQKGIIFSFALITAAFGQVFSRVQFLHSADITEQISSVIKKWVSGIVEKELAAKLTQTINGKNYFKSETELTHGQLIYLKYGISGARGEAENGYQNIIKHSLPELRRSLEAGYEENSASIQALIALISQVEDSNIVFRSDIQTLKYVQNKFKKLKRKDGILNKKVQKEYNNLCKFMKEKSISPGGSADLLAATHLLYSIEENLEQLLALT